MIKDIRELLLIPFKVLIAIIAIALVSIADYLVVRSRDNIELQKHILPSKSIILAEWIKDYDGVCHHIRGVFDGLNSKIYVDGVRWS